MKNYLPGVLFLIALLCGSLNAQDEFNGRSFAGIKDDYNQVAIVAHIKITNVKFTANGIHTLYSVKSEIVEPFKGGIKKGESFTFYFRAEEDYDVRQLLDKEWIVFLESKSPIPGGGEGWFELENSKISPSKTLSKKLRKLKKDESKPKRSATRKTALNLFASRD
jgi:hypothetical protein